MNIEHPKAFEQTVGELLSLSGYDVDREILLGHKKVDLYFEERHLGSIRRVAVECKWYSRALTQADLTAIYANYLPLHDSNLIDEILVVTREGLTPSAQTMVREIRDLFHLTFADLQNMIMDFRLYLMSPLC